MGYKGLTRRHKFRRSFGILDLPMNARVQAIAERACRSETFRSSPRLRDFLRYLVKRAAVEGQAKETVIGVEFFQRDPGYDPRKDTIVRVEAHRLRRRLREYYQNEGAREPWQIDLPPGAYLPLVRRIEDAAFDWRLAVIVEGPDPLTSEGLTAELIRRLGALRGVKVLAPLSSLKARNSKEAIQQLGANAILDCRVDGPTLQATLSRAQGDQLTPVGSFDNVIQRPSTR